MANSSNQNYINTLIITKYARTIIYNTNYINLLTSIGYLQILLMQPINLSIFNYTTYIQLTKNINSNNLFTSNYYLQIRITITT